MGRVSGFCSVCNRFLYLILSKFNGLLATWLFCADAEAKSRDRVWGSLFLSGTMSIGFPDKIRIPDTVVSVCFRAGLLYIRECE